MPLMSCERSGSLGSKALPRGKRSPMAEIGIAFEIQVFADPLCLTRIAGLLLAFRLGEVLSQLQITFS